MWPGIRSHFPGWWVCLFLCLVSDTPLVGITSALASGHTGPPAHQGTDCLSDPSPGLSREPGPCETHSLLLHSLHRAPRNSESHSPVGLRVTYCFEGQMSFGTLSSRSSMKLFQRPVLGQTPERAEISTIYRVSERHALWMGALPSWGHAASCS